MKKFLVGAGAVTGGILYLVLGVVGLLIHLWTILISLAESGVVSALVSLVLPVFAEVYWALASWKMTGTWLNTYTFAVIAYAVLFLLVIGIVGFCGWQSSKIEQEENQLETLKE